MQMRPAREVVPQARLRHPQPHAQRLPPVERAEAVAVGGVAVVVVGVAGVSRWCLAVRPWGRCLFSRRCATRNRTATNRPSVRVNAQCLPEIAPRSKQNVGRRMGAARAPQMWLLLRQQGLVLMWTAAQVETAMLSQVKVVLRVVWVQEAGMQWPHTLMVQVSPRTPVAQARP